MSDNTASSLYGDKVLAKTTLVLLDVLSKREEGLEMANIHDAAKECLKLSWDFNGLARSEPTRRKIVSNAIKYCRSMHYVETDSGQLRITDRGQDYREAQIAS